MSSRQPPAFVLPGTEHSSRTLILAKRAGLAILISLLVAGGVRVLVSQRVAENLEQRTAASLKRSVIAVHPRSGDAARKVNLPASLRGNSETPIFARASGYLSAWHKTIGDTVRKGDLLATIEVPELEQELAQAKAQRNQAKSRQELAESNVKRWEVLRRTDSAPEQEYEEKLSVAKQAGADLDAADANVKRLEQLEGFRRVVAPFGGVVTRRNIDVGNLIATGTQELFTLAQTDPLRLTVWVPQAYADDVRVGQEVNVRFPESQGRSISARIEHLAGALDPVTRARQVDITLPNKDGKFLSGAYAEVVLNVVSKSKALLIPANALVIDQTGSHVVAVDRDSRVVMRPVKLGRDFGREVEVLEGVGPDDVLIASPSDLLVQGEQVTPVEIGKNPGEKGVEKTKAADSSPAGQNDKPKS
jgi:RND family efflux transporter MFP subunit